jgi:dTDP-4-amino-4,6-dideoxygalactose transaminase
MTARDVAFLRPVMSTEAQEAAQRVLTSGWLTTGPECAAFEEEFADRVAAEHAVAVSSCSAGLELSLRALRLPPRSRVLVPTITFCGAVQAISHAGLLPVLVDVDPATGMVSPATCAAAARGCGGAAAMMVLHFAGFPAPVAELAEAAGLPLSHVVEDAAHALGTWVGDHQVGSISRSSCFSFHATKNLPIGEGGMVTTDDGELAAWLREARLHGMSRDSWRRYLPGGSWRYTVADEGLKANLSDLQAAIGRAQLRHFADWQRRRAEIVVRYGEALAALPGVETPPTPARGRHAWHLYVIRVKASFGPTRDQVAERLAARGIGTSVHFIPLHHFPWGRSGTLAPVPLRGADLVFAESLSLPLHPSLSDHEVDLVCDALAHSRSHTHRQEVTL